MDDRGVTLFELVVVLSIIGIVSAVAWAVLYRGADGVRLKATAREVSAALRYARAEAVARKKVCSFVMKGKGYGVYLLGGAEDEGRMVGVLTKNLPAGIIAEGGDGGEVRIDFHPLGDSTGGLFRLRTGDGQALAVTVEPVTGRVKVERGD